MKCTKVSDGLREAGPGGQRDHEISTENQRETNMNKLTLTTILVASLVAGCAHDGHGLYGRGIDPAKPKITVEGDMIKLDQELLIFRPNERGLITWSLPENGPYRFPENGIVIEGRLLDQVVRGKPPSVALDPDQKEIVDCAVVKGGLQFTCNNKHTTTGLFKYTIRVTRGSAVLVRDPNAFNM